MYERWTHWMCSQLHNNTSNFIACKSKILRIFIRIWTIENNRVQTIDGNTFKSRAHTIEHIFYCMFHVICNTNACNSYRAHEKCNQHDKMNSYRWILLSMEKSKTPNKNECVCRWTMMILIMIRANCKLKNEQQQKPMDLFESEISRAVNSEWTKENENKKATK